MTFKLNKHQMISDVKVVLRFVESDYKINKQGTYFETLSCRKMAKDLKTKTGLIHSYQNVHV